jgi:hypothetical protein
MNDLVLIAGASNLPPLVTAAGERDSMRFLEFFVANIRNPYTRLALLPRRISHIRWRR